MLFRESYINSVCSLYKTIKGVEPDEAFREEVGRTYDSAIFQTAKENTLVLHNPEKHTAEEIQTEKVLDLVYDNQCTMSAYGLLIDQFKDNPSPLSKFLIFLQDMRKAEKKLKFDHINDEDPAEFLFHDIMQLLYKLVGNSEYGGAGERNYILGSVNTGPGTTYNGYAIITATIYFVESFMEGNFFFFEDDDAIRYIEEVAEYAEKYPTSILHYVDSPINDPEVIVQHLASHAAEGVTISKTLLRNVLKNASPELLTRIYYKNNLYAFLSNKAVNEVLGRCYNKDFIDPNKPPEAIKADMGTINMLVKMYIIHPYLHWNRADIVAKLKRKSILVTDTDSVFCLLYNFILYFEECFSFTDKSSSMRINLAMIANNIISNQLQTILDAITGGLSVDPSLMPRINMKSEFLMKRLALTRNKKQYSSIVLVQEGKVILKNLTAEAKPDIKGLPIRKSSTNRKARDYFTKLLKERILMAEKIDPRDILQGYMDFEHSIYESLTTNRETFYLSPGKYNSEAVYANPNTNSTVKAVRMWNAMSPNDKIQEYSRINLLPIREVKKAEDLDCLKEYDEEMYNNAIKVFDEFPVMFKSSGAKFLALPKKHKSIPASVLSLVDTNKIVEANLKAAHTILESVGFVLIPKGNGKSFSSFVNI